MSSIAGLEKEEEEKSVKFLSSPPLFSSCSMPLPFLFKSRKQEEEEEWKPIHRDTSGDLMDRTSFILPQYDLQVVLLWDPFLFPKVATTPHSHTSRVCVEYSFPCWVIANYECLKWRQIITCLLKREVASSVRLGA